MEAKDLCDIRCGLLAVMASGLLFLTAGCKEKTYWPPEWPPQIMCVEEADGKYCACYISPQGFLRWKGVRLTEEQLPTVWTGPLSVPAIVFIYERPTWLRRLRGLPEMHYFAPPPYRIIGEGDLPIEYGLYRHQFEPNLQMTLQLGCRLGTELYLIKEVKSPLLKKNVIIKGGAEWTNLARSPLSKKNIVIELWGSDPRHIRRIDIPAHRVKEVETLLSELIEPNPASPPAGERTPATNPSSGK